MGDSKKLLADQVCAIQLLIKAAYQDRLLVVV
jgi:hypothetical protein